MKCLSSAVSTVAIFLAAALVLFVYLLGMRYHAYLPVPLFLISVGLMLAMMAYQCVAFDLDRRMVGVVLLEITIANLLFHLVYQIPGYGLWGSDAYYDFASMKAILDSGFVRGVPIYTQITSYFPVLHILGSQTVMVTGIDALSVAKWFPSVIDIAVVPLLFLLVTHLFKRPWVSLLSVLLFVSLQHRSLFGSFFIRETIAVVLAVGCAYLYLSAKSSGHPFAYRLLSVLLMVGTVLAHHLTSAMLIMFLGIHLVVTNLGSLRSFRKLYFGEGMTGERMTLAFVLLTAVITLTYWVTTVIVPLRTLAIFMRDLATPSSWGRGTYVDLTGLGLELPTMRYYILIYGSYLCYAVFGLLMLGRLLPKKGSRHIEVYSFTAYLVVCGVLGVLSFYLLPRTVIGDRFVTFGWLFGFGPLVMAIYEYKNDALVRMAVMLVVAFLFVNLYTIHPTEWNPKAKGSGATASQQDFNLAGTLDFTRGRLLANLNNNMAIYHVQNVLGNDAFQLSNRIEFGQYDWIVVNRKGLDEEGLYSGIARETISDLGRLDQEGTPGMDLRYVSNNLSVFQRAAAAGQ